LILLCFVFFLFFSTLFYFNFFCLFIDFVVQSLGGVKNSNQKKEKYKRKEKKNNN